MKAKDKGSSLKIKYHKHSRMRFKKRQSAIFFKFNT